MPLPNIVFSPVYDIHLVRGQNVDLLAMLHVGSDTAATYQTNNPTVTYTFTPFFDNNAGSGTQHSGFNITVDTASGSVTTQQAVPTPEKHNFLVRALAKLGAESSETFIRIHIHHAISDAWLSPHILTAQKGTSGVKFSVRVKFDDDVVAEVNEISSGPSTTNNHLFPVTWHHPNTGLIDASTGLIHPSAIPDLGLLGDPVEATIAIPALGINQKATGQLFLTDFLAASSNDTRAQLVSTGNCPGFARANEIPNILFIPEGFTSSDSDAFDSLVDHYVNDLVHGKITAPFDILSGSMNFWKVFMASGDRGVTTRSELYVFDDNGKTIGVPFPFPAKPLRPDGTEELDASKWSFVNLYYHLGLPVRADKNRPNNSIRDEWHLTSGLAGPQVDAITEPAIDIWKSTAERRLPEELDTALGLIVNDYTAGDLDADFTLIHFNGPKRLVRADLDPFLSRLKDADSNEIGKFFVSSPLVRGKDYDNIVFVTNTSRARENNFDGGFFVVIKEDQNFYTMKADALTNLKVAIDFTIDVDQFPLSKRATLTHELGHSFALEDEYGEPPPSPAFADRFVNDPLVVGWHFTKDTNPPQNLDWSGNVQARQDLLTPDPNHPGTALLDPTKLKWRYHRIQKCGVVANNLTQSGTQYNIPMQPGHAAAFAAGDKVFLRKRAWFRYTVSRPSTGSANAVSPQDVLMVFPDTMKHSTALVTKVNAAGNQITISDEEAKDFLLNLIGHTSASLFSVGDMVSVDRRFTNEPIAIMTRTPPPPPVAAISSDTIVRLISQELEVVSVAGDTVVVKVTDNSPIKGEFLNPRGNERMILYRPMDAPAPAAGVKYAEVLSKKMLDHLTANPFALNARKDAAHGNVITEIIDNHAEQSTTIPANLVPCCNGQEKKIVGLYSGGDQFHGDVYHPAGKCFMRDQFHDGSFDEFCIVCKYVLVDLIDPTKHGSLNTKYFNNIYPT